MPTGVPTADPQRLSRIAGALYLAIIILGLSGELLVRAALVVPGDAATTAANITANEGLFRLGIAADAVMAVCDVGLAVLLYVLLRPASALLALLAMVFRLIQAAIIGGNLLNQNAALLWLAQPGEASQTMALVAMESHSYGYDLGLIFFGVSCLILGYLIVKAPFIPRLLGVGLFAAGVVYLTGSFLRFLAPDWAVTFQPVYLVPLIAEASLCLWLLIRGVEAKRWPAA